MQRPHFWKAILNVALLKDQVKPQTLHQLVTGQFQALRFENIANIDGLHAMRDDLRKRILAATVKDEGESYLIILEVVENHDYDKSRFLKPGVLKKYLEDNMDTIQAFIKNKNYVEFAIYSLQGIERIFELEPTAATDAKNTPTEPRPFLSMIFTAEQREISDNCHFPLVFEGVAGAGKSSLALAKLADMADKYVNAPSTKLLYVTQSGKLATHMHDLWLTLPIAEQVRVGQVTFIAYEDLFKTKLEVVGFDHFEKFADSERRRFRQQSKNKPAVSKAVELKSAFPPAMPEDFFANPHRLYLECRMASGFVTEDEYEKLGDNQSLIPKHCRAWFLGFYRRYIEHLGERYFDYGLCRPPHIGEYDFMFVDEMQNLSYLQLIVLAEHARAGQIGYCGDKDQTLKDLRPCAKSDFLKNWLSNYTKSKVTYAKLTKSHRGSQSVLRGAQCVLDIKALVTKEHRSMIEGDTEQEGSLRICRSLDEKTLAEMRNLTQLPSCAVITQTALIEKVKKDLDTPLVFDVSSIIGLEFETVIHIDLLASDIFFEIDRQLQNIKDNRHVTPSDDFGRALQNLYVALTRAILNCIMIVGNSDILHRIVNLLERLEAAGRPERNPVNNTPQKTVAPALSTEEKARKWRLEITRFLKLDPIKYDYITRAAFIKYFPDEDYESFKAGILGTVRPPVKIEEPREVTSAKKDKVVAAQSSNKNTNKAIPQNTVTSTMEMDINDNYDKITSKQYEYLITKPQGRTLLFDTPTNNGESFFVRLVSTGFDVHILNQLRKSKDWFSHFTKDKKFPFGRNIQKKSPCPETEMPPLYFFCKLEDSLDIFSDNPILRSHLCNINRETLMTTVELPKMQASYSAFANMMVKIKQHPILIDILKNSKKILAHPSDRIQIQKQFCTLFMAWKHDLYAPLLLEILKHVPDLLKDVPLNRLFLGCDMDFDMPEKKLGKKLLKTVREKAAHLFPGRPKELKIEDIRELQKIVSLTNDDKKFSYLTVETNVPNLELLHELFSRYKEDKYSLYKYIFIGSKQKEPVFSALLRNKAYRDVIISDYLNESDFNVSASTLCNQSDSEGQSRTFSLFTLMACNPKATVNLENSIAIAKEIKAREFRAEELVRPVLVDNIVLLNLPDSSNPFAQPHTVRLHFRPGDTICALDLLSLTNEGRKCLKSMLDCYPDVKNYIKDSHLAARKILDNTSGMIYSISDYLQRTSSGEKFLKKLVLLTNNASIFSTYSEDSHSKRWYHLKEKLISFETKETLLPEDVDNILRCQDDGHMLFNSPTTGINITLFERIFKDEATRSRLLSEQAIWEPKYCCEFVRPHALFGQNGDLDDIPPIVWLAGTDRAAGYVNDWMSANQMLVAHFDCDLLFKPIKVRNFFYGSRHMGQVYSHFQRTDFMIKMDGDLTLFDLLVSTKNGRAILKKIILSHPEFASKLPKNTLFRERFKILTNKDKSGCQPISFILEQEYNEILKYIFRNCPHLAEELTDDVLLLEFKKLDSANSEKINLLTYFLQFNNAAAEMMMDNLKTHPNLHKSAVANYILDDLRKVTDDELSIKLSKLFSMRHYITLFSEFLHARPEIIQTFHPGLFKYDYTTIDNTSLPALTNLLLATSEGRTLYQFIQQEL